MHQKPENDHEAAMARADLYKLAQYSAKLFKMIQEGQPLEGWVQAKITKAADYISSVYHFMAYEMKVSEYGEALENAEVYESELRDQLHQKLLEAKEKVKALKKADAIKHKSHKTDKDLEEMRQQANEEKSSTGGEIDRSKKGVTKHTQNPNRFSDEPHTEPKSQAKSKSAAEKKGDQAADRAEEKEGKNWEKRFGKGSVTRVKDGKKVDEAAKPDFLDMDKDGNKKEPMKKAVADKKKNPFAKKTDEALKGGQKKLDMDKDGKLEKSDFAKLRATKVKEASDEKCNHTPKGKSCPVHGMKECGSMYEASTGDYSAKKAAAGKDIGKPGKNFAKIEKSAGGGEKGKKIAGAVLAKLRGK